MASTTYEQKRFCEIKRCGKIDHLGNVPVMVRNAGQLPQPFWLGAARGGADSRSIKMPRQHLTHDEAEEWCDSMVNADGTKGCHWTLEQTQDVAKQRNITCDPNDFWAVMNMMYSDYCQVAKRQSVDTPGFYADMAKAFLEDADAADGKAYLYWDCIADK